MVLNYDGIQHQRSLDNMKKITIMLTIILFLVVGVNLNFNEIGDEGTAHISNANFSVLEQLFLFHNNISSNGVKSFCNANFISTLIILSLSENPQITDEGCKYIRDQKAWNCLTILNLNRTGLTNNAIEIQNYYAIIIIGEELWLI